MYMDGISINELCSMSWWKGLVWYKMINGGFLVDSIVIVFDIDVRDEFGVFVEIFCKLFWIIVSNVVGMFEVKVDEIVSNFFVFFFIGF